MSQSEVYRAARELQAQCNDLPHSQQEANRTVLADLTNNADTDEDDRAGEDEQQFVRTLGKKMVCTHLLWIPDEEAVFEAVLDDDYNSLDRFNKEPSMQPQARIQGAICDVLAAIPEQYQSLEELQQGWVKTEVCRGAQRWAWRNRLRANPSIFGRTIVEFSSAEREKFAEAIGRRAKKDKPDEFYYDTFNVPLLHKDYDDEFDINKIFLNKQLFIVHAALMQVTKSSLPIDGDTPHLLRALWTPPILIDGIHVAMLLSTIQRSARYGWEPSAIMQQARYGAYTASFPCNNV
ncbi:hypothetical protein C8F01DRAFT_1253326 [Mycena amicta]|nr:hypothetical protein C8F01DRAFT_1253326 [Mycena amicta]